jgi:hypothetical protein
MVSDKKDDFGSSDGGEAEMEESAVLGSEEEVDETEEDVEKDYVQSLIDGLPRSNVVNLLPVHAAPHTGKNALKVTRGRGRPRKVERAATTSDLVYHAKVIEEKGAAIDSDSLVRAATLNADSADMLHLVKIEVAREAASLLFQRTENEKYGRDTSQVSTRRIDALKKIADIELEVKKIGAGMIDLKNEKMQRVFKFLIGQMREVAQEVLAPEAMDLYFNRLSTALEGWEDKCSELVASKDE